MKNRILAGMGWIALAVVAAAAPIFGTQQKKAGAAPVPAEILSAGSVFISNLGPGCSPFGYAYYSGGPERTYNEFYAAMKNWGRYRLASSPAGADLDFEISLSCPEVELPPVGVAPGYHRDPQLKLVILDLKTHAVLWTMTRHIELAMLQRHIDQNLDSAVSGLVNDLKALTAPPAH